jgi:tetratricopeptide (TPR) repeat protein
VIQALREKTNRWLLLLDAADSEQARDAVKGLLKELAGGRIIITSRRDDWPLGIVHKIPLDVFAPEEARKCLQARYWKQPPSGEELEGFSPVATELGNLPLALTIAAGYMNKRRITPQRYLQDWHQKRDALLDFSSTDLEEENRSLLAAFKLSYDLLSPQAAHLLHMLAWLGPEPFPRRLVEDSERMKEILSAGIEGSAGGDPTEALAELRTLSLLQLDDESVRLHKLVLQCARAALPKDARADACTKALEWINSILPDTEYDETNWKLWNRLSPHLDEVIAAANELKIEGDALGVILDRLGRWLFYQAGYNRAEPLLRRSLSIDEKSYGPEHPNVAIRLNNLALLLRDTNRREEAEPLMRRALAIDEKSYGPEHPAVATRLSNLALLLQDTNRREQAEPLMRRALAIEEKTYGLEHPNVARDLNNLAQLLKDTNRLEETEPMMRRVVVILLRFTRSTGYLHPHLKAALANYLGILEAMSSGEEEIARRIAEVGKGAGFDEQTCHALVAQLSK